MSPLPLMFLKNMFLVMAVDKTNPILNTGSEIKLTVVRVALVYITVKIKLYPSIYLQEIDEYITQARQQGYKTILNVGHKTLTYATNFVVTTAVRVSVRLFLITINFKRRL